jgi:hypothetical protein
VGLLLLAAVPLAGLTAYLALRRLVRSVPLRLWGAVSYALLPPLLGAVATGRLGTVVVAVLLPLLALAVLRALGLGSGSPSWRAAWAAGLLLAVMAAFVPLLWVVAAVAVLARAAADRGRTLPRAAVMVLVPPLLLLPWLPALVRDPQLLLLEAGLPGPGLSERGLTGVDLLLLRPGGPGLPPVALAAGLLLAALAGLLRPSGRRVVLLGWLVAVPALAGALLLARTTVTAPTAETAVSPWPGPLLLVAGAGLVVAAVAGAAGARARVAGASFGWRQPGALVVLVLAAVAPVLTAGWWVGTGAGGPLERRDPVLLPAFVAAQGDQAARPRTLVLRARAGGGLTYSLLRSDGPRTGDAELTPTPAGGTGLDAAVADLAAGRGGDAAARLVPYGVRFVLLSTPGQDVLARAVDAVPGMMRVSGQHGAVLWQVDYPTGRLRVLPPGAPVVQDDGSPPPARVLPAGQTESRADIGPGAARRLLVLADAHDGGWRATVDGVTLTPRRYDGWAQAFVLPAGRGRLHLTHDPGPRPALLWLQLVLLVVVVVLALPQVRAALDDADGAADVGADLPEHPAVPAAGVAP